MSLVSQQEEGSRHSRNYAEEPNTFPHVAGHQDRKKRAVSEDEWEGIENPVGQSIQVWPKML